MFTGIIESIGVVAQVRKDMGNIHFEIASSISSQLKIDQSISHNGVCLTVTKQEGNKHWVTAIYETLRKSNLGKLKIGDEINLERSMLNNGRFDGHIVQGHVDKTGICKSINEQEGSWLYQFAYEKGKESLIIEKGSICIDGVSLTCFNLSEGSFEVAVIPFTYEHTTFKNLNVGDTVNLEFDIIGKYIQRLMGKQ
ncbi:MAG: riboflavin synthase [Flammeovirgaceae bacterium]|nr:riboflavin synthase [Flammeovirgaceae bacterium]